MRRKISKVLSTPDDREIPIVIDAQHEVFEVVTESGKRAAVVADDYQWAVMMAEEHFRSTIIEVKPRPFSTTEPAGSA